MNFTDLQDLTPATRRRTRAVVVVAAVLAAGLVWVIAVALLGVDVLVPDSPGSDTRVDLELPLVLFTAAVASLAGWGFLALLERFTARAATIWTVVAIAVFVLTLPYTAGFRAAERVVLALMHLALAVILIVGMLRTANKRRLHHAGLSSPGLRS